MLCLHVLHSFDARYRLVGVSAREQFRISLVAVLLVVPSYIQ